MRRCISGPSLISILCRVTIVGCQNSTGLRYLNNQKHYVSVVPRSYMFLFSYCWCRERIWYRAKFYGTTSGIVPDLTSFRLTKPSAVSGCPVFLTRRPKTGRRGVCVSPPGAKKAHWATFCIRYRLQTASLEAPQKFVFIFRLLEKALYVFRGCVPVFVR